VPDRSVLRVTIGACVVAGVVACVPVLGVVVLVVVESPPPPQPANEIARQAKDNAVSFAGCVIHGPYFPGFLCIRCSTALREHDNVYITYIQK